MNEFIEQFLVESREHIEQAMADLLALEKAPDGKERLDSAFRAFHTLKGSAGIVDFAAMADAVHAAEDALSRARSGARVMGAAMIGDCLACLDQVVRWLDRMELTGELPDHADAEAAMIVERFARSAGAGAGPLPATPGARPPDHWTEDLVARDPALAAKARTAIRYAPEVDCFYDGRDPLARIANLPGLLMIDLVPATPWPPIDTLDPFACNVVLAALTTCPRAEAAAAMGDEMSRCDIRELVDQRRGSHDRLMPPLVRELLEAQVLLLRETGSRGAEGRAASAGRVAANIMRGSGRSVDADHVTHALAAALAGDDPRLLREVIETLLGAAPAAVAAPSSPTSEQQPAARTLRVDAARIDALVSLTGELTVAKNSIGHAAKLAQQGDPALAAMLKDRHATLDRLVAELQRSVLAMRVVPLRQAFQRLPRLLREISNDVGKPARLLIEGAETEADKAIVEMLFEPLLHVLRNAMGHGIEDAATRAAHRKPSVATIGLSASREGEHVVVEMSDDGAGVDVARIRRVALERSIASEEILAAMTDQEVTNLIFEPGLTTAGEVTGLSGRGVGMDAVRTAVERLAGQVSVDSRAGLGTTVRFTLPFSVMMTRVMVVSAGEQAFGVPLDTVVETLRVDASRIVPIGAAHAIVLRNRTIPVVALAEVLGLPQDKRRDAEATLVVTKINGLYGALQVDRIGERIEVMLKPLEGLLAGMRGMAGSTLQGDGSVLLILDLGELF